jgi:hypothetical protein
MHCYSPLFPVAALARQDSSTFPSTVGTRGVPNAHDKVTPFQPKNDSVLNSTGSTEDDSLRLPNKAQRGNRTNVSSRSDFSRVNASDTYRPGELSENQQQSRQREALPTKAPRTHRERSPATDPRIRKEASSTKHPSLQREALLSSDPRARKPSLIKTNSHPQDLLLFGPQHSNQKQPTMPTIPAIFEQASTLNFLTQELEAILDVKGSEEVIRAMFGTGERQACLLPWKDWNAEGLLFTQYLRGCNVKIFDDIQELNSRGSGVLLIHASCPLYDCLPSIPQFNRLLGKKDIRVFRIGTDPMTYKVVCQQLFHKNIAIFICSSVYKNDPEGAKAILNALETRLSNPDRKEACTLVIREKSVKFEGDDQKELSYFKDLDYEFLKQLTSESEGKPAFGAYRDLFRAYGDWKAAALSSKESAQIMPTLQKFDDGDIDDNHDVNWFAEWFIEQADNSDTPGSFKSAIVYFHWNSSDSSFGKWGEKHKHISFLWTRGKDTIPPHNS